MAPFILGAIALFVLSLVFYVLACGMPVAFAIVGSLMNVGIVGIVGVLAALE